MHSLETMKKLNDAATARAAQPGPKPAETKPAQPVLPRQ